MSNNRDKIILAIALLLVIFSLMIISFLGGFFYDKIVVNDCSQDPLVYASKMYEAMSGEKVVGSLSFIDHTYPRIYFDSEGVSISYGQI